MQILNSRNVLLQRLKNGHLSAIRIWDSAKIKNRWRGIWSSASFNRCWRSKTVFSGLGIQNSAYNLKNYFLRGGGGRLGIEILAGRLSYQKFAFESRVSTRPKLKICFEENWHKRIPSLLRKMGMAFAPHTPGKGFAFCSGLHVVFLFMLFQTSIQTLPFLSLIW